MLEKDVVISQFKVAFDKVKKEPIVLYGFGKYSKMLIEECQDYHIIGLMGEGKTSGDVFGKKVLSREKVEKEARYVVIIARRTSVKEIYQRIKNMEKRGVTIFNYAGKMLGEYDVNTHAIAQNPYWNENLLETRTAIKKYQNIVICAYRGLFMSDFLSVGECLKAKVMENSKYIDHFFPRKDIYETILQSSDTNQRFLIEADQILSESDIKELLRRYPLEVSFVSLNEQTVLEKKDTLYIGKNENCECERVLITLDGYEIIERSGFSQLLSCTKTQGDKRLLRHFIRQFFNSPYCLSESKGRFPINSVKELAGGIFGPLILAFLSWLYNEADRSKPDVVFFLARDGYLIEKIYKRYRRFFDSEKKTLPKAHYILASRRALAVPCIQTRDDIISYLFYPQIGVGTFGEVLKLKYGVTPAGSDEKQNTKLAETVDDELKEYILLYEKEIIHHAQAERSEYRTYLSQFEVGKKNVWIFDLVTAGTAFRFISKLLASMDVIAAELVCFQYLATENESTPGVYRSYFKDGNFYEDSYFFSTRYPLCEVAFSSGTPMFLHFDKGQKMFFNQVDKETIRLQNDSKIKNLQEAIIGWIDDFHDKTPECFDMEYSDAFIDSMYGLVDATCSETGQEIKKLFFLENYWQNTEEVNLWDIYIDEAVKEEK